ncbi:hypothetical protein THAOC_25439, partial [Thalassiosira oceanica]
DGSTPGGFPGMPGGTLVWAFAGEDRAGDGALAGRARRPALARRSPMGRRGGFPGPALASPFGPAVVVGGVAALLHDPSLLRLPPDVRRGRRRPVVRLPRARAEHVEAGLVEGEARGPRAGAGRSRRLPSLAVFASVPLSSRRLRV